MTWPNFITLGRLFSTPFIVWLILTGNHVWAFWVTIGAGLSDILDGLLARLLKTSSKLGAYLDPFADKILLMSVYCALGFEKMIPGWIIIAVVFRDILILSGIALLWGLGKEVKIHPLMISKINTFFQIFTCVFVLAHNAYHWGSSHWIEILCFLTTITTFLSALGYVGTLKTLLKGEQ